MCTKSNGKVGFHYLDMVVDAASADAVTAAW